MDFSKLDTNKLSENTFRFEILHPVTADQTGAFIDVYGNGSDVVKQFLNKQLRKTQKQEFENARSRKPKFQELNDLEEFNLENALVRVAGWEGVEWENKALDFNEENARKLLKACPWLREQIIEHSTNLGNFLTA
ncbi:MAG: hypothetical protein SOX56_07340 [[Pasteurella] mairii]|uniref:Uncharacterized protein n=1 Tax=[Pasteurella] mairii TaxID=757 RepID=A0A379B466_9PAST|nr:hypothetical protein [[Pasteurella] mairii]SUB33301.1 Uncharacterised protein [[Pasteurella] mairii]